MLIKILGGSRFGSIICISCMYVYYSFVRSKNIICKKIFNSRLTINTFDSRSRWHREFKNQAKIKTKIVSINEKYLKIHQSLYQLFGCTKNSLFSCECNKSNKINVSIFQLNSLIQNVYFICFVTFIRK